MRNSFILIVLIALLTSCEFSSDYPYIVGDDFLEDPARVIMVDTLTLKTYTIVSDSVPTSYVKRLLAGKIKDEYGLITTTEGYFMIDQPEGNKSEFHETAKFDSAHFVLWYDGYSIGDTTKLTTFAIYELTETLTPDTDSKYFFGHYQFDHKELPIGTFKANELEPGDSIVVRIDQSYGQKLFDLARNKSTLIETSSYPEFNQEFKGFVIKAIDAEESFIFGIKANPDTITSPRIRIFYKDYSLTDYNHVYGKSFYYPLRRYNNDNKVSETYPNKFLFNHISTKTVGTSLEELKPNKFRLPSALSNEITHVQAGVNMQTVIYAPYIDNLRGMGIGSVIGAELYFYPDNYKKNSFFKLPKNLQMDLVDNKNVVFLELKAVDGKTSITSKLYEDKDLGENTYYTFDVTRYVKNEYESTDEQLEYGLALHINNNNYSSTVDRLAIGSQKHKNKMKMKVYLTKY
jgi:hypothetical protein